MFFFLLKIVVLLNIFFQDSLMNKKVHYMRLVLVPSYPDHIGD